MLVWNESRGPRVVLSIRCINESDIDWQTPVNKRDSEAQLKEEIKRATRKAPSKWREKEEKNSPY